MSRKVSIIIPCYNGAKYLPDCLESILNQTYESIELVFINDGSTEPIKETVLGYKGRFVERGYELLYLEQENLGQSAAINKGLLHYSGDYLMWMDADDRILPENIRKKVRFLEEHPECGFVLCEGVMVRDENPEQPVEYLKRTPPKGKDTLFPDLIFERNVVYGPGTVLVRRENFERSFPSGQIIENRAGQNMQLMLPLAFRNRCGYIPEVLFQYVRHADSHFSRIQGERQWIRRHGIFKNLIIEIVESLDFNGPSEYPELEKHELIRQIIKHRTKQQLKIALKAHDIRLVLYVLLKRN